MKLIKLLLSGALAASGLICAQSSTYSTAPIGFNKVVCLTNSDTIVGVPFRQQGSLHSKLQVNPNIDGDSATLTLQTDSLAPGALTSHYLKFIDGDRAGRWYDIQTVATDPAGIANTSSAVTISLNGDTLGAATTGDAVIIAEYWTLATLFPPAEATTDAATTGHAIVASTSTLGPGRRTEVRLPNLIAPGINVPPEGRYYINEGIWKRNNSGNTNYGSTIIYPDSHFRISHPPAVTEATTFRSVGEVDMSATTIYLSTSSTVKQDNYIAIPRPISVSLNDLNLLGTEAFVASTNTLGSGRQDELLIFDNELQLRNKAPSARYYVHDGIWKLNNGGNTDRGGVLLSAGVGIMIRKSATIDGSTSTWTNLPTY